MGKNTIKKGDIVRFRPPYLDSGEKAARLLVLEDNGDRVLTRPAKWKDGIVPTLMLPKSELVKVKKRKLR